MDSDWLGTSLSQVRRSQYKGRGKNFSKSQSLCRGAAGREIRRFPIVAEALGVPESKGRKLGIFLYLTAYIENRAQNFSTSQNVYREKNPEFFYFPQPIETGEPGIILSPGVYTERRARKFSMSQSLYRGVNPSFFRSHDLNRGKSLEFFQVPRPIYKGMGRGGRNSRISSNDQGSRSL